MLSIQFSAFCSIFHEEDYQNSENLPNLCFEKASDMKSEISKCVLLKARTLVSSKTMGSGRSKVSLFKKNHFSSKSLGVGNMHRFNISKCCRH
jgi:hypothetical protein